MQSIRRAKAGLLEVGGRRWKVGVAIQAPQQQNKIEINYTHIYMQMQHSHTYLISFAFGHAIF